MVSRSDFSQNINRDVESWKLIGGANGLNSIRSSLSTRDTLKEKFIKLFRSKDDVDSLLNIIHTTNIDIENLSNKINKKTPPETIRETINKLNTIRDNVLITAGRVPQWLEGELPSDKKEKLNDVKELLNNTVLPLLETQIKSLGANLEKSKKHASELKKFDLTIEDESFTALNLPPIVPESSSSESLSLSSSLKMKQPLDRFRTIRDLEQKMKTGSEKFKDKFGGELSLEAPSMLRASLKNDEHIKRRQTIQEIGGNGTLDLPLQFVKDLTRSAKISINDKTVFELRSEVTKDSYSAAQIMLKEISKFTDKGELALERLARIMHQGTTAQTTNEVIALMNYEEDKMYAVEGGDGFWSIHVDVDNIEITFKSAFLFSDFEDLVNEDKQKMIMTKTVYKFPLKELLADDLEKQDEPLPSLTITKNYSPIMSLDKYEKALKKYIPYDSEAKKALAIGSQILEENGIKMPEVELEGKGIVRAIVKGKDIDITPKEIKDPTGEKSYTVPAQFANDLDRIFLSVNNERIVDPNDKEEGMYFAAIDKIASACSPQALQNILRLTHQSTVADLGMKAMAIGVAHEKEAGNDFAVPGTNSPGQHWNVRIKGNMVELTMRTTFTFTHPNDVDGLPVEKDSLVAKRTILVPLEDLDVANIEELENPLPRLRVTDTFSKPIENKEYALDLMESF